MGASWVQKEVLAKNNSPHLRVYAVWFDMVFGDSRSRWDGAGLADSRVTHLWDERKVVGNWYSANVTQRRGTTWDFYAVYGPEARDLRSPLSMGAPIIFKREDLAASIGPLLANGRGTRQ